MRSTKAGPVVTLLMDRPGPAFLTYRTVQVTAVIIVLHLECSILLVSAGLKCSFEGKTLLTLCIPRFTHRLGCGVSGRGFLGENEASRGLCWVSAACGDREHVLVMARTLTRTRYPGHHGPRAIEDTEATLAGCQLCPHPLERWVWVGEGAFPLAAYY